MHLAVPDHVLGRVGAAARRRAAFTLQVAALFWGVLRECSQPLTWRRTLRAEMRAMLTRTVGGSLEAVGVTAIVVGLGLVFEVLYWSRNSGETRLVGRILVVVLVREITPLLIGIILLGRGGAAAVAELGMLKAEGEVAVLRAEGIDIFQYLVLPRAVAFAVAAFALGVVFVIVALVSGFVTGSIAGVANRSIFGFFTNVLRAITFADLTVFAGKLLLIGLLVALVCCATGLAADDTEPPSRLLPRGFTRGIASIMAVTLALSALL